MFNWPHSVNGLYSQLNGDFLGLRGSFRHNVKLSWALGGSLLTLSERVVV